MTAFRLSILAIAAMAALAVPSLAQAQPDQEPVRIVRAIYAPYIANKPGGPGQLDLIRPHASQELVRLIEREEACLRRSRGICALDYDMIVDGQDYDIKGLQVTAVDARPGAMTARASFRNFNRATVVDFSFAMLAGQWKLTDVVSRAGSRRMSVLLRNNK